MAESSRTIQPLVVSTVAKEHPLFPVLSLISRQVQQNKEILEALIEKVEKSHKEVQEMQKELHELISKQNKCNFSLKKAGFEGALRSEVGGLFCESIFREVADCDIQRSIRRVLREEAREKFKFDCAVKYIRKQMSTFRTEERRKIYGITPCEKFSLMKTRDLAEMIMNYMSAPESKSQTYFKHLVLLRKFTRENPDARKVESFTSYSKIGSNPNIVAMDRPLMSNG